MNHVHVNSMIKKLRIVFSGIENSGKSTLSRAIASELGFEFIEEQCRYNKAVIEGVETPETLIEINSLQESMALESMNGSVNGVVCDTSSMELRMWSKIKFECDINCPIEVPIDLNFLCQTLEDFEEDPLRQMPDYADRVEHELEFIEFLKSEDIKVKILQPSTLEERKKRVISQIKKLING